MPWCEKKYQNHPDNPAAKVSIVRDGSGYDQATSFGVPSNYLEPEPGEIVVPKGKRYYCGGTVPRIASDDISVQDPLDINYS